MEWIGLAIIGGILGSIIAWWINENNKDQNFLSDMRKNEIIREIKK